MSELSAKIHTIVDVLGYSVYFAVSEAQESDSTFVIPILSGVDIECSGVLADKIIDCIYDNGGESTIPPKTN